MEQPQRRDINELLVNGYFKTSRAKSPAGLTSTTNSPSFLNTGEVELPRQRSRSQELPRRRTPRPTVEDEAVSLSRESSATSSVVSYDPPLRGIVEQNPIILEAEVSTAEVARLQTTPCPKDEDGNPERRFVFIPKTESVSSQDEGPSRKADRPDAKRPEPTRKSTDKLDTRPQLDRRPSRQDLPSLQTKVPRDLPPQYRRSASAYGPTDNDLTPQPSSARAAGEYLLSPDVPRGKDYFGAPRQHHRALSFGRSPGTPVADKRMSGGSAPGISWNTASTEKRNSRNFERSRSRRTSNEKLTRPQELSEEYRRKARNGSANSRLSVGGSDQERPERSSPRSSRHRQSDSESDIADSGSDKGYGSRLRPQDLQAEDPYRRSGSRSNRPSRHGTSPLPSPTGSPSRPSRERERAETFPQRSGSRSPSDSGRPVSQFYSSLDDGHLSDKLSPMDLPSCPRSRQSHSISTPMSMSATHSSARPVMLPIPIPAVGHHPDHKRPQYPQVEESRSSMSRSRPNDTYWQPPPFHPPSDSLQKPVGSFRRYSEDVDRGAVVPLPSCPRTNFVRGKNDWLTLPQCSQFDICPSCFNSTIAPTEYRDFFVRAQLRSPETEVLCDFGSSPWYRIAWLLTRKKMRRDMNLFYGVAKVATKIPPCAGKHMAVRQWHSLIDPKTRDHIHNFNVCSSCVKSVEILLPPIRGLFRPIEPKHHMGDTRICGLRFDSKRFIQYFDALETAADKSDEMDAPPDTRALVSLCKRMSLFPECERDRDLLDQRWNVITQLPEFTVCEECFDEVVWPELEDEKAIPMMFNKKLQKISVASCQLYSPKMRGIFRTAVDGDDYKLLASKARERKTVEMQLKKDLDALRRLRTQGNPQVGAELKKVEEEWRKWE
ncbi:hypothetical protein BJ878DRAFT_435051 [Calycina marina]|uniref:Uncharacterized protein n=1 Tax=Calycina marina TaxID=1763456 RepID=A0A9P7Z8X7_9HELO|nr:hypothetical protein BJ878DRAFT_435051 [Calycina marina]